MIIPMFVLVAESDGYESPDSEYEREAVACRQEWESPSYYPDGARPAHSWVEADEGYKEPKPYSGNQRVNIGQPGEMISTEETFKALFPRKFFKQLKDHTNSYAQRPLTDVSRWKPITTAEARKFVAMLFHMALVENLDFHQFSSYNISWSHVFPDSIGLSKDRFSIC